jgi:hypothetical protein
MGRGLSQQQREILGLAYQVSLIHGQPVGRGEYFRVPDEYWRAGLLAVRNANISDVTQAMAVHFVWQIPLVAKIDFEPMNYGSDFRKVFRSGYTAANSGVFCNSSPGVKSAKVAATKAIRRLVERELLAVRFCNSGYMSGYCLTASGFEIGKSVPFDVDSSFIIEALTNPFNRHGKLGLKADKSNG